MSTVELNKICHLEAVLPEQGTVGLNGFRSDPVEVCRQSLLVRALNVRTRSYILSRLFNLLKKKKQLFCVIPVFPSVLFLIQVLLSIGVYWILILVGGFWTPRDVLKREQHILIFPEITKTMMIMTITLKCLC